MLIIEINYNIDLQSGFYYLYNIDLRTNNNINNVDIHAIIVTVKIINLYKLIILTVKYKKNLLYDNINS